MSSGNVGRESAGHVGQTAVAGELVEQRREMIRIAEPVRNFWTMIFDMRLARSGPLSWAPGEQLGALVRRRRLRFQQQQLEGGAADYKARPPYPFRPRPPS